MITIVSLHSSIIDPFLLRLSFIESMLGGLKGSGIVPLNYEPRHSG